MLPLYLFCCIFLFPKPVNNLTHNTHCYKSETYPLGCRNSEEYASFRITSEKFGCKPHYAVKGKVCEKNVEFRSFLLGITDKRTIDVTGLNDGEIELISQLVDALREKNVALLKKDGSKSHNDL